MWLALAAGVATSEIQACYLGILATSWGRPLGRTSSEKPGGCRTACGFFSRLSRVFFFGQAGGLLPRPGRRPGRLTDHRFLDMCGPHHSNSNSLLMGRFVDLRPRWLGNPPQVFVALPCQAHSLAVASRSPPPLAPLYSPSCPRRLPFPASAAASSPLLPPRPRRACAADVDGCLWEGMNLQMALRATALKAKWR